MTTLNFTSKLVRAVEFSANAEQHLILAKVSNEKAKWAMYNLQLNIENLRVLTGK